MVISESYPFVIMEICPNLRSKFSQNNKIVIPSTLQYFTSIAERENLKIMSFVWYFISSSTLRIIVS